MRQKNPRHPKDPHLPPYYCRGGGDHLHGYSGRDSGILVCLRDLHFRSDCYHQRRDAWGNYLLYKWLNANIKRIHRSNLRVLI